MDIEKFLNIWWSQGRIALPYQAQKFIDTSYQDPLPFWNQLFNYAKQESHSILFQEYDFYHDCILRHLSDDSPALKVIQSDQKADVWTYRQIHQLVNIQAHLWKEKYGVEAGQTVVLVVPYGLSFVVGLMTALRLGAVVSSLPTKDRFLGRGRFAAALEQLSPDFVLIQEPHAIELDEKWTILDLDLSEKRQPDKPIDSYTYLGADILQKVISPNPLEAVRDVQANSAYLCSLRDGICALNLKKGTTWARPLSSMLREEPYCTITALLAGACIVAIKDDLLVSNPARLKEESIDMLGVSKPLQQLWLKEAGAPARGLKNWHKNPLEGDTFGWTDFSEINQLQKVPSADLLIDKTKGGITLFSRPKPVEALTFACPSLGSPWDLLQLNGSGDKAVDGSGFFQIGSSSEEPLLVLSQIGEQWVINYTTKPTKEGIPYPIEAIETCVQALDFIHACMIVSDRHPKDRINAYLTLLCFISPKNSHISSDWAETTATQIKEQIGEAFVPDRILFYPLYPKAKDGALDRLWTQNQHQRGLFFRKQNHPIYRSLNLLKEAIYEKK